MFAANSEVAPISESTVGDHPSVHSRRRRLKWTLIALLLLGSFCLSIYLSSLPGAAERRFVGCWTTTLPDLTQTAGDHHVFMHLTQDRTWTTWWRDDGDTEWQHSGNTGRWSFNGGTIELRTKRDRQIQEFLDSLSGASVEQLVILESGPDQMLTRFLHSTQQIEWTRVSEDSLPQIADSGPADP